MSVKTKRSLIESSDFFIKHEPRDASLNWHDKKKQDSPSLVDIHKRFKSMIKLGVWSPAHLLAAGFKYTGNGDTARCNDCGLEAANWTENMDPFTLHLEQKPDCPFIHSTVTSSRSDLLSSTCSSTTAIRNTLISDKQEDHFKRQKIETNNSEHSSNTLFEIDLLKQVRRRTFSHWPPRTIPSSAQMIEAGFFNCNVGDRVICIYCNLICQQWTPHTDDPCEVHKTLSPNCIYVKAKLIRPSASSIIIINESLTKLTFSNYSPAVNNHDPLRSNEIVFPVPCNPTYAESPKRHASFAKWPHENLPSVDDLVRAGFFYTGTKTIVTCFYCNGSLQNWGPNDNPMIKHARWFPLCAYAKQLCGDEKFRKIRERVQQERAKANKAREKASNDVMSNTNVTTNSRQLLIPDESTLSRLVAARLDLPISQRLLDQNFKLSIIKRCWEDQLRLKQDDFVSECDLYIACLILQKQIEHIDGKKENIVIPSIKMKQIREQNEARMRERITNFARSTSNTTDVEMTTPKILTAPGQDQSIDSAPSNSCVVCLIEERQLAFIPCGHLATCVPCGHSLQSCPTCRRKIEAFVRIYT